MKKKIIIIILLLISYVAISQEEKFFIEAELTSKISFGEITRNDIEINSGFIVNVPKIQSLGILFMV